jgi:hypothetical protein
VSARTRRRRASIRRRKDGVAFPRKSGDGRTTGGCEAGDSRTVYDAAGRPVTAFDRVEAEGNSWMTVARSITVAVLIALPFWVLIACAVYPVL